VRVYTALREWIDTGRYAPGEKIASEEEIGQMFGVSRITTRKAIDLLVDDDLVYRMHGKGTYVSENVRQRVGIDNIKKRMRAGRRRTHHSKIQKADVSVINADPRTCLDLKLPPDSKVLRASYIRTFSGQPVGYMEAFIPIKFGLEIKPVDLNSNTPLRLLEQSGVEIGSANQLISATLADSHLADLLGVLVGSPLLRIKHVVLDAAEQPVERFVAYYRADQYEHPMVLHEREDLDLVHGVIRSRG